MYKVIFLVSGTLSALLLSDCKTMDCLRQFYDKQISQRAEIAQLILLHTNHGYALL